MHSKGLFCILFQRVRKRCHDVTNFPKNTHQISQRKIVKVQIDTKYTTIFAYVYEFPVMPSKPRSKYNFVSLNHNTFYNGHNQNKCKQANGRVLI